MASLYFGSELLETVFTPQEENVAMQLMDKNLSMAYLQNTRVGIFRQLAAQEFTDPTKDGENQRYRAYLKGQLDLLESLINGVLNPKPVPVDESSQTPGA